MERSESLPDVEFTRQTEMPLVTGPDQDFASCSLMVVPLPGAETIEIAAPASATRYRWGYPAVHVGVNRGSKTVSPGALFALNHLALSPLL